MRTQDLKRKYSDLWRKNLEHPFLREIEADQLPIEKFRFYMKQDYLYLLEYCKALALMIAKSEEEVKIRDYTEILHSTINTEMEHHKQYCERVGIEDLAKTEMAPTTAAYTQYLLKTAYSNSLPETIAVILPCFWVYLDMGWKLDPSDTREEYRDWILMYRSEEFEALIQKLKDDLDQFIEEMSEREKKNIEKIFERSLRYEYKFWEMSYNMEIWEI